MRQFLSILRSTFIAMLFGLFLAAEATSLRADDDDDDDDYGLFVPNQIVVKLDPSVGTTVDAINATYQTTTIATFLDSASIYLLQTPPSGDTLTILEQMESDSRLLYAEPNFVGEAPEDDGRGTKAWGGQDATPYAEQYALAALDVAAAHEINQGSGTIVAVLDTGIQASHPVFTASLTSVQYDFIGDDALPDDESNGVDDDGNGEIDEATGHGTHVAGIVKLAAPNAQIMPLRVLDSDGSGNVFLIAEAIYFAAQHGADVINLSLGTTDESELLDEVIADAVETHDVFIVAAAGNLNSEIEQFPAAMDGVMAVTAFDATSKKSSVANYGSWIDLSAPGESIYSAFPPNGYAWWTGTSMATPFIAAQAALLRSYCPTLEAEKIFDQIQATAQSLDESNPEYSGLLGKGRADFAASLQFTCSGSNDSDDDDDDDSDDDGDDNETPVDDTPVDDTPVDDTPIDDIPVDDDITEDGSVDDDEENTVSPPANRANRIHIPLLIHR